MTLVRGNHDRHAGDPPAQLPTCTLVAGYDAGHSTCRMNRCWPLRMLVGHAAPHGELAGHGPGTALDDRAHAVALPCFWRHHRGVCCTVFRQP